MRSFDDFMKALGAKNGDNLAGKSVRLIDVHDIAFAGVEPHPNVDTAVNQLIGAGERLNQTNGETGFPKASGFRFSQASLKELTGVDQRLVQCVKLALDLSTQDFCVYDGIRTIKEQQKFVAAGTSKTMKSKHLEGLAVDLVPWVNGKPVWDWNRIYPVAFAMDEAATRLGYADVIRWGGAWDRVLSDFGGNQQAYADECAAYADRHPGKDFLDGPHFELVG